MFKKYEYKLYTYAWVFKETLPWAFILNDFNYSSSINAGQWDAYLELNKPFNYSNIILGDFIKVYVYSDNYLSWKLIYTWEVSRIERLLDYNKETIKLSLLWLWTLLNRVYARSGWSPTFTKNQDPAQTIKDIIDYFNTVYTWGWISYSGGWITNFWSNINISIDYRKCLDAINDIVKLTTYYFIIGWDWQVIFKTKPVIATHLLTVWKDINSLNILEDWETIVNNYILTYNWWTTSANNWASQSTYWIRELRESKTNINDLWSANTSASSYITDNKDYSKKTTIEVNNKYNLENINVWESVSVLNTNLSINNLQIQKINYNKEKVTLYLDNFNSLGKTIFL